MQAVRFICYLFSGILWLSAVQAQSGTSDASPTISGVVFLDENDNGRRDRNEKGIQGAIITDQEAVSASDKKGRFTLTARHAAGIISVMAPLGYQTIGRPWYRLENKSREVTMDIPLSKADSNGDFTFIHASDPHISPDVVNRMRRVKTIADSLKPEFVLVTGDLVKDALRVSEEVASSYYQLYVGEIEKFSMPVYSVPGNHEIFGIERHKSLVSKDHPLYGMGMYHKYLGPSYYPMQYGGLYFLGLNSVTWDDLWYYGEIDSIQVRWMRDILNLLPSKSTIITFNHIPFVNTTEPFWGFTDGDQPEGSLIYTKGHYQYRHSVANTIEVIETIREHHEHHLALGGHLHWREQISISEEDGRRLRFYQVSAVAGSNEPLSFNFASGVILYRVRSGVIDDGEFIPLGP